MTQRNPSRPLLEVQHLSFPSQGPAILEDINLKVHAHQISAIVGTDGAGKTTLLKVLSGLLKGASGSILFEGESFENLPAWEVVKRGLVYVPEGMRVFPHMSVLENLEVGAYCQRRGVADRLDQVFRT
ncbi:MAG: ATP-binding cassette domain-containing protein, partial [Desulfobaccales bacterium]